MATLIPLPAFTDNYIWCYKGTGTGTIVVDPGDADPVIAAMNDGMSLQAIFITHHHPDHIGGLSALRSLCDVPVYGPEDSRITGITQQVRHGDCIELEGFEPFTVWQVPGHTLSHVAYFDSKTLFCGDTLFSLGCGRLFEGTPEQMLASLDLLMTLPDDTKVCCTHEYTESNARFAETVEPFNPCRDMVMQEVKRLRMEGRPSLPSDIGTEKSCNPFLRSDQCASMTGLVRHLGFQPESRLQCFTALRKWKDCF
jgi:hydroxyacylglutathione hydrolase